jgi:hypothetical protein
MAAEYTNASQQTINPGESVIFTESPVPCTRGLVRHRDGTGNVLLRGVTNGCPCAKSANYLVDFGADIAIPTGGTVGEISVAIAIDGSTIPASTMTVTPAAVEEFFNVSKEITAQIWRGCCETVTIRNTSDQPIIMQNADVNFDRPDLR